MSPPASAERRPRIQACPTVVEQDPRMSGRPIFGRQRERHVLAGSRNASKRIAPESGMFVESRAWCARVLCAASSRFARPKPAPRRLLIAAIRRRNRMVGAGAAAPGEGAVLQAPWCRTPGNSSPQPPVLPVRCRCAPAVIAARRNRHASLAMRRDREGPPRPREKPRAQAHNHTARGSRRGGKRSREHESIRSRPVGPSCSLRVVCSFLR